MDIDYKKTSKLYILPAYTELIKSIETKTEEAENSRLSTARTAEQAGSFIRIYIERSRHFLEVQNT